MLRTSPAALAAALLSAALTLAGCQLSLRPTTAQTAADAGHRLSLVRLRGGMPMAPDTAGVETDLRLEAWPEGAQIVGAGVAELGAPRCVSGTAAHYFRVQGDQTLRWAEPLEVRAGQTVQLGFPRSTWRLLSGGPSRVDVILAQPDGSLRCASFPLGGTAPRDRWTTTPSWTVAPFMNVEGFSSRIAGLMSTVSFGAAVGRWLGPIHLSVTAGGGTSQCSDQVCEPPSDKQVNNRAYVPLTAGLDATLVELWILTFDLRAHYRVGFTSVDARDGERSMTLHGPVLTPTLALSLGGLPLPWGVRALHSAPRFLIQAPLSYVMSSAGPSAYGAGMGVAFELPLPR